ncbi:zinc-ribbon domain-containing protein [Methylobacillus gramineus]|uniref:DUF3426 domain-containing protein n=1 Tax=Methylobacillus gramineus TaxID=755169 RepID=UPI001CFFE0B6|nr:DUF3426 domain-containing protein [Methylobacillus gramineus]MCB5185691.1 zinc-ribbon domain-containing protein [Methylobacillus gramineus]
MRLVTSCPACDTQFHVKPEQLAAHHGTVRCGQCQHVFNTQDRLYELLEPLPVPLPDLVKEPSLLAEIESENASSDDSNPAADTEVLIGHALSLTDPLEPVPEENAHNDAIPEDRLTAPEETIALTSEQAWPHVDADATAMPLAVPPSHANAESTVASQASTQTQPAPIPDAFLKGKKPSKTTKHNLSLWLSIPLCILLLLMAAGQAAYFFRTELASHWPASKPLLISSCELLGCEIPLSKNPELLALDDSDLQEDIEHPEVIQLSTTLINNAAFIQAYPMLELTLTDDDDKPKLRRIFKPSEYLPDDTDIEAGIPSNEEVQIRLSLSTSGEPVSGYRVFVTY